MFGLEEKGKRERFVFDLEKRIKDKPEHGQELVAKAEHRIQEIKKLLREGANEKDFDKLGVLLHAYGVLQRILKRAAK